MNITTATMWMSLAFLILVVLHNVTSEETKEVALKAPTAKYAGRGYGYDNFGGRDRDHGYSRNNGYGQRQRQGYSRGSAFGPVGNGGRSGYDHSNDHEEKHVPIKIPYIDRNGCRFPGDVVCDPAAAAVPVTFLYCILSTEGKNLWKKPSMTVPAATTCADTIVGTRVLAGFCNDNERLLKAAGLIETKKGPQHHYHLEKYSVRLNPCILTT